MKETPKKDKLLLEMKASRPLNRDTYLLTFATAPDKAAACLPGQFFNLRPLDSTAPLLRRPISICDARPESGEIDFLVKRVGEGTSLLTKRMPGAMVDAIGPLGNPFSIDPSRPAIMVAGGVGVAPLYFLAKTMRSKNATAPITFCYGARSGQDFVLLDSVKSVVSDLVLATEDGSQGQKGYVTTAAEPFLTPEAQIFVCGPSPMMNALLKMLQARNIQGQLSLENLMGCGVGACQGCVVPGRNGMIRVCCDGPVVSSDLLESVLAD